MSDLVPVWDRQGRAVEKAHGRDLRKIEREVEKANARIEAISQVRDHAIFREMTSTNVQNRCEQMAPDGAERYALLALEGTVGMGQVIRDTVQKTR